MARVFKDSFENVLSIGKKRQGTVDMLRVLKDSFVDVLPNNRKR